jgi:Trk K+ transport system NAD-binding subunit
MANNALWIILQRLRIPLLVIIITYSIAILGMVLIPGADDNGHVYHLTFFDAFYFVSYMASTIGFGEAPYTFTYEQRIWVSFCIYLTVIGWFYGIGTLVSVITDKQLKHELMRSRFKKAVQKIQTDFTIVLGYNSITSEIIKKAHKAHLEVVLIEKEEEKVNLFFLESMSIDIPVAIANALLTETLIEAGIKLPNCKGIISLFKKEEDNLRIAILTRFLNTKVKVVAKSTQGETTTSLIDTDISEIINPFEVFAKRLDSALNAPHRLILENWIYGNSHLHDEASFLPHGKYIVCGYGRFGKALKKKFEINDIDYTFIDEKRLAPHAMIESGTFIYANPDDKEVLIEAGIQEAVCLIVGTQNDIANLSIVITAKKLNPNIYIIARENTMEEVSIFQAAPIDWIFIIERILVNKSAISITKPLKQHFLNLLLKQDESFAKTLVKVLCSTIGKNPLLFYLTITEESAYAIYHELKEGEEVTVDILTRSLENWKESNNTLPLLIQRQNRAILLPEKISLELGDEILFACNHSSKEEIELIASNIYELHYAKNGIEKQIGLCKNLF